MAAPWKIEFIVGGCGIRWKKTSLIPFPIEPCIFIAVNRSSITLARQKTEYFCHYGVSITLFPFFFFTLVICYITCYIILLAFLILFSVTALMSGQQICLQKLWHIFMPRKLCLLLAACRFVTFKMHENFYLKRNFKNLTCLCNQS